MAGLTADVLSDEEFEALWRLRDALDGHRWPWAPLGDLLGGSVRTQAGLLGVHQRQVSRWRSYGLTDEQADRCAIGIGSHPALIWANWHTPAPRSLEERRVA